MKAVIDEGVPRRLALLLRRFGAEVANSPGDWRGLANGRLPARVDEAGFQCLITCDRNLTHQQKITGRKVGVTVLPAQRFEDIEPYAETIASAPASMQAGTVIVIAKLPTKPKE